MNNYDAVMHKLEMLAQMFRQTKQDAWADVLQEASANLKFLASDQQRILLALRILSQQNAKEYRFNAYEQFVKHICSEALAGKALS